MATAELAMCMPAVLLLLAVLVGAGAMVVGQVQCVDAARSGARAAARGDDPAAVRAAAARVAPSGAEVRVQLTGDTATVDVRQRFSLPPATSAALTVHGTATAQREQRP